MLARYAATDAHPLLPLVPGRFAHYTTAAVPGVNSFPRHVTTFADLRAFLDSPKMVFISPLVAARTATTIPAMAKEADRRIKDM
jgi:hypothetical protein